MSFKELQAPSLTELFIQEMERMILSGELKAGEKLPTERELSEKMKVSRAVINGGLNRLADMGFVRIVPRKGAFVSDYIATGNMDVLNAIMEYNGWRFTPEFLEPILQFRLSIEPDFVELAAGHSDSTYLQVLPEILAKLNGAPSYQNAGDLIFQFFHTLSLASGNIILPLLVRTFMQVYKSMGSVIAQLGYLPALTADFESIYHAVSEGQSDKAREEDILCIEHAREWIGSHYKPGDLFS